MGSVLVGSPRFRHRGRGPTSCSEELTHPPGGVCGPATTTCCRSIAVLVVRPPRRFGVRVRLGCVAIPPDRVRIVSDRRWPRCGPRAPSPMRVLPSKNPTPPQRSPITGVPSLPTFRHRIAPTRARARAGTPDADRPQGFRSAETTGPEIGIAAGCLEPSPSMGFWFPSEINRGSDTLFESPAELRSHVAVGGRDLSIARRGTPVSSRSRGRASLPGSGTPSRAIRWAGLLPFAGSRRSWFGEPKLP
jgi:hypothetical protein